MVSPGSRKLSYNYKDIAFSPFDDYWKEIRKLSVQELFNIKRIHSIQPIKYEEMRKLMTSLAESGAKKSPVNMSEKLLSLTAGVVCRASFGVSFQDTVLDSERFNELVPEALEILGSFSASDFYPYIGWILDRFTGLHKRRERSAQDLDAFCEQMIDLHLKKGKEENEDFVDLLMKLEKEKVVLGQAKFTTNNIKALLIVSTIKKYMFSKTKTPQNYNLKIIQSITKNALNILYYEMDGIDLYNIKFRCLIVFHMLSLIIVLEHSSSGNRYFCNNNDMGNG